jgi:hypothetical protein
LLPGIRTRAADLEPIASSRLYSAALITRSHTALRS